MLHDPIRYELSRSHGLIWAESEFMSCGKSVMANTVHGGAAAYLQTRVSCILMVVQQVRARRHLRDPSRIAANHTALHGLCYTIISDRAR